MIKQNIVEDITNLYSSIYEQAESQEDQELLEDIVNVVCLSMIYEGYSAKAVYNFFENANIDEIFYRYENFDESVIYESTLPEEYIQEQIQVLNEVIGAITRVARAAFQGAKYAPKGQKINAAFKSAGTAATRVGTQGTRQSSVVRATGDKVTDAAKGLGTKLKSAAVPALVGGTTGYVSGKMSGGESDSSKSGDSGSEKTTPSEPKVDSSKWSKDDKVVLARKGGVQGKLNKTTGEWEKKEWDDPEQQRYQKEKEKTAAKNESYSSYDIVLDYLFENGHVDTLEEAHYVMLEMDSETIQSIVEAKEARENPDEYERNERKNETRGQSAERNVRDRLKTMDPEKRKKMIAQMRAVGLNV